MKLAVILIIRSLSELKKLNPDNYRSPIGNINAHRVLSLRERKFIGAVFKPLRILYLAPHCFLLQHKVRGKLISLVIFRKILIFGIKPDRQA